MPTLLQLAAVAVIVQFPVGESALPVPKSSTIAADAGPTITSTARTLAKTNTIFIFILIFLLETLIRRCQTS
jgi:hypothetical protein